MLADINCECKNRQCFFCPKYWQHQLKSAKTESNTQSSMKI